MESTGNPGGPLMACFCGKRQVCAQPPGKGPIRHNGFTWTPNCSCGHCWYGSFASGHICSNCGKPWPQVAPLSPPTPNYTQNKTLPNQGFGQPKPPTWEHIGDYAGHATGIVFSMWVDTATKQIYTLQEGADWSTAKLSNAGRLKAQARMYLKALRKAFPPAQPFWTERSHGKKP